MAAKIPSYKQWIKPEIYPLFLAVATALSMGGFVMARSIAVNPDVRISKQDREAGVLENYKEGEVYKNHRLRHYALKHGPQIMPSLNNYFSSYSH
uniref:NADH-ubiquinone reductase complex 1 MLRQ subunit n=1 Tax=Physcomitrium patens TaxID=3218 RepID=A9RS59_PHYPA|nr:hypothetical protein PHYPA_004430 [Physcomitrium patens]